MQILFDQLFLPNSSVTSMKEEIEKYYSSGVEKNRLKTDVFQLEFERSKEIIQRFLNASPLNILDAGGGTGVYSFWLKSLGHTVHLLDASKENIDEALMQNKSAQHKLSSLIVGNSLDLPYNDETFDIVLLMGPLYHFQDKKDRIKCYSEAYRVLKKNGLVIAATISRFASMLDGFSRNLVHDQEFLPIIKKDLATGNHENPTDDPEYFTTAYFHHPDELQSEAETGGLNYIQTLPVESFGWLMPDFNTRWKDDQYKTLLIDAIKKVEKEKSLLGISSHFLTISKK